VELEHDTSWLSIYFSYETAVGVHGVVNGSTYYYVSQNVWSRTTGRHLNEIDGGAKEKRVPYGVFEKRLAEALQMFVLSQNKGDKVR